MVTLRFGKWQCQEKSEKNVGGVPVLGMAEKDSPRRHGGHGGSSGEKQNLPPRHRDAKDGAKPRLAPKSAAQPGAPGYCALTPHSAVYRIDYSASFCAISSSSVR